MISQEAQQFVARFIKGDYTPGEYAAFLQWLKGATVEELNDIADTHESLHEDWVLAGEPSAEWVEQLERKLDEEEQAAVIRMRSGRAKRRNVWMAAASVVVILSAGAYLYLHEGKGAGSAALQNREKGLTTVYSNPAGSGQQEVVLSDGSKVWLNAASTLKCPPRFNGSERLVELSGEGYFEVAANASNPFRVLIKDAEVEVLGTNFNIAAYADDPESRTTLVNGAVKIKLTGSDNSVPLQPGQLAEIIYASPGANETVHVRSGIDPKRELAWRDNYFDFDNADLGAVMRTIARAYNVAVEFSPNTPSNPVTGDFDRRLGLDKLLKQIESFANVHIKNNGKTVIVTPI